MVLLKPLLSLLEICSGPASLFFKTDVLLKISFIHGDFMQSSQGILFVQCLSYVKEEGESPAEKYRKPDTEVYML